MIGCLICASPTTPSPLMSARSRALVVVAIVGLAFGGAAAFDWYRAEPPGALRDATYVGRASCIICHAAQANAFAGSDHDRAMELATDETVLGDFSDAVFER